MDINLGRVINEKPIILLLIIFTSRSKNELKVKAT
jgi:hypothetical protein